MTCVICHVTRAPWRHNFTSLKSIYYYVTELYEMSQGPSLEGERERGDRAEYQTLGFLGPYEGWADYYGGDKAEFTEERADLRI